MKIELYNCSCDLKYLDKSAYMTNKTEFNDVIFHNTKNIESISFDLVTDTNISNLNYMYIPNYNKYYIKTNLIKRNTNRYTLEFIEDYLMSHKDKIKNISCIVSRSETNANAYLLDNKYQSKSYQNIVTKKFPNGFSNDSIILMTVG